ncbi:hypothetical protein [Acrocarpospora sp. B8E8]|uniref:hypothetical protein n=1 Tax=Acrocarpospora sp. B8E8 TaxID=3153572 RepID=UPI00325FDDC0
MKLRAHPIVRGGLALSGLAFSLPLTTRRVFRQWLEPYNDQCVATLRGWVEQETRTGPD